MLTKNQFSQSLCVLSKITILIPFIFMFNSCKDVGVDFNETLPNPIITYEELKIYGKIIDQIQTQSIILVKDTTRSHGNDFMKLSYEILIEDYSRLQIETYNSLTNTSNKRRVFINPPQTTKKRVILRSNYTGDVPSPSVYGLLTFSEIGFNNSKTQALIFIVDYRTPLDASAYYIALEKVNTEWTLVKKFGLWIS